MADGIDILFVAFNRLQFTAWSLQLLLANTDWSLVRRVVLYDDNSTDGTFEYLNDAKLMFPVEATLRRTNYGGPPEIMRHYVGNPGADVFAKIDNDIAVPPGWLPAMLDRLERFPDIELLGMAMGWTGEDDDRGWEPATHIGGVGLMRRGAFTRRPSLYGEGRQGFTQWQHRHNPVRGWIVPDLPVVQMDLIPAEPFVALTNEYHSKGWEREVLWAKHPGHEWRWVLDQLEVDDDSDFPSDDDRGGFEAAVEGGE